MTYSSWDESEHPRDDIGRFTYKNGGTSNSDYEKREQENKRIADILYLTMQERADILYPNTKYKNSTSVKKMIINNIKEDTKMVEQFLSSGKIPEGYSIEKLYNNLKQSIGAIVDFGKNYLDIRNANTKESDKYFHAKANCQAAQHGNFGADMARELSDKREDFDLIKNKYKPKKDGTKMTRDEIIKDYHNDQKANVYGRVQGLKNPDVDCRILVDKYRPKGLDKRY